MKLIALVFGLSLLALFCLILLGLLILGIQHLSRRSFTQHTAAFLRARPGAVSDSSGRVITYQAHGIPARLHIRYGGKASRALTRLEYQVPTTITLSLRARNIPSRPRDRVPGQAITTGDPDFDEAFKIHSEDPEQARAFLDPELRRRLLALRILCPAGFMKAFPDLSLDLDGDGLGLSWNANLALRKPGVLERTGAQADLLAASIRGQLAEKSS